MKKIKLLILFVVASLLFYGVYSIYINKLNSNNESTFDTLDYRQEMRQWVITIAKSARLHNPEFIVIPQNCSPLFTENGQVDDAINMDFLYAIDGVGQEDLTFGDSKYNSKRNEKSLNDITAMLNVGKENGLHIFIIDYCDTNKNVEFSKEYSKENGFIGFQAESLELTNIQIDTTQNENSNDINNLSEAQNFLILLNPMDFDTKDEYLAALTKTNYDVLIIDAHYDDTMLSEDDIQKLKQKPDGGSRLIISYLSIGEAEDYRFYWQDDWTNNPPEFILSENPLWEGNYPVKYWDSTWQEIIALGEDSYLSKIIGSGFDGVYLDIVDGYEAFEDGE